MKYLITLLAVLIATSLMAAQCAAVAPTQTATEHSDPHIKVMDVWARQSPMAGGNGAVYMMLLNEGSAADTLQSIASDAAEVVELHETKIENDVMKMQPLADGIEIPGGGSAELKPGGMHVMLIGLKEALEPGHTIALTLNFKESGPMQVEAEIRDMGAATGQEMEHDHDMADMDHAHERIANNGAVIHLISPADGATVNAGEDVKVEIETKNVMLHGEDSHWHIYIDDELETMVTDGVPHAMLLDLEPGTYEISVYLATDDHKELEDGDSITLVVEE